MAARPWKDASWCGVTVTGTRVRAIALVQKASLSRSGTRSVVSSMRNRISKGGKAGDLGRETSYWIRMIRSSVADSGEWIALLQEGAVLIRLLERCREEAGVEVEQPYGEGENE